MDSMRELKADAINSDSLYVTCPYNGSHRILKARLQYHLVKCRRNNSVKSEEEKEICPLDATHHVNKEDLARHMEICPNRKIVESEKYLIDSEVPEPAISYKLPEIPPCEENWDDPNQVSYTYDPSHHLENQPILRTMHGATKSERKAFRQVERIKMIQFQSGQPMNTAEAAAAVGVKFSNGKITGLGRGQNRLPLGYGATKNANQKKYNLDKVLGDGVGHTVPCPVETGPLRHPKQQSLALRLAECSLEVKDEENNLLTNNHKASINVSSNDKPEEKSKDADIVSGFGLKETDNANENYGEDNKKIPVNNDWWNHGGSSSAKGLAGNRSTVNLEEYKEKVKESRLAAKMGLPTSNSPLNDDDRARDFTYLDEEWKIQGRRGRNMRGYTHANGPLSRGKKW